ncbi:hypothetical protein A5753_03820 [Mycobacterium sp. 852002-51971_SCH5477799-a]|uniref:hypothetical protein n=1 Tax=Mycobacterium sp. 852002-51971_SCH5477799-a TaxID=1834106 RepID=UPI000801B25A|nr:hypothetical protein [Mycobacterium sp. 852002-51971_SCH5477799-a]OBF67674.1 hypothetical protein A5753_03820 [Mycobacterium sp. 852002-51971_SCH5477799-a]
MKAEIIGYAFVGEVAFAAMAAGALVALAALLKVMPPKADDSRDGPDGQKEPVMAGTRTAAGEHPNQAEATEDSSLAKIGSYM